MWCACMGMCMHMCVPALSAHPRGTYIVDEVCDVSRADGQHAGWRTPCPAEWSVPAQWRPSQRGAQGCHLCWVAQLADVIGILWTKCMELSQDPGQGRFLSRAPS